MSKWMIAAAVSVLLCATGSALGQLHRPSRQSASMMPAPMTPELKARLDRAEHLNKAASAALDAGQYAEAEADARQSLSVDVGSGLSRELLAVALYRQRKTQAALRVYQTIAEGGAYAARNEWPYALLLLKTGQWAQAVDAYNTALGLGGDVDVLRANTRFSPDVPQPAALAAAIHIGMGVARDGGDFHGTRQDRDQQAQAQFQEALALEPGNALTNYYVGYGFRRLGRGPEATAAFQKAADLDRVGEVRAAAKDAISGR